MANLDTQRYRGPDLEIFVKAINWRAYLARRIAPHLGGDVLEVGAGIGTMTKTLTAAASRADVKSWLCLEPDPVQAAEIGREIDAGALSGRCRARAGSLANVAADESFDAILYIDVLEHIEADSAELSRAAARLRANGRLVVMSPAHQWLFSPLDEMAGHFRRYTRATLAALTPADTRVVEARYLDCVGMAASFANRALLRQGAPGEGQLKVWDRGMVPLSRILDPILGYRLGKSILMVWEKT